MTEETNLVELTAHIVGEYVGHNNIRSEDLPGLIASTYGALSALGNSAANTPEPIGDTFTPAVTARNSLASKEVIISMIDGKPYKTLRRHLANFNLSPEEYRERYNLPATYPMTAPAYSEMRRAMAKQIGLGRKPGQTRGKAK